MRTVIPPTTMPPKMSPGQWYELFQLMVAKRMEEADHDFLVKFLGDKLTDAKVKEEERLGKDKVELVDVSTTTPEVTQAVDDSEDAEGIPTVADMIKKEDEEYGRWLESELSIK